MKSTAYYIKTLVLMLFLTIESLALSYFILSYIKTGDYFTPSVNIMAAIGITMLLLAYTYSLTIGSWGSWEQYVIVPLPISIGIFMVVFNYNPGLSPLVALGAYGIITYGVFTATHIITMMAKFEPRIILRLSLKTILMVFSLLAALLVFIYSEGDNIDVGTKIGSFANDQINKIVQPKPGEGGNNLIDFLGGKSIPTDPELYGQLGGLNVNNSSLIGNLGALNLDLGGAVASEVNQLIEPYRRFLAPLIALLTFGLMQFLAYIVTLVYSLTIPLVFALGKKSGFFTVQLVPTVRENLTFKQIDGDNTGTKEQAQ